MQSESNISEGKHADVFFNVQRSVHDVPVLENGRMTPVPATVSPSGEDRNSERVVWPGWRADRRPESTAVRERPRPGI